MKFDIVKASEQSCTDFVFTGTVSYGHFIEDWIISLYNYKGSIGESSVTILEKSVFEIRIIQIRNCHASSVISDSIFNGNIVKFGAVDLVHVETPCLSVAFTFRKSKIP